ncbi:hypothetical protein NDU88_011977, partial [Pleurodeles waltl]
VSPCLTSLGCIAGNRDFAATPAPVHFRRKSFVHSQAWVHGTLTCIARLSKLVSGDVGLLCATSASTVSRILVVPVSGTSADATCFSEGSLSCSTSPLFAGPICDLLVPPGPQQRPKTPNARFA